MPTQIEEALVTLVPLFNALPSELVSLANALLVQSKAKAANLKPDEEISRTYACANIACERSVSLSSSTRHTLLTSKHDRLKTRLGLEKLQPRPPVPPRIYKKLYSFLDQTLATPATPRTERQIDALGQRSGGDATPRSGRSLPRSGATKLKTPVKTPIHTPTNLSFVEQADETPSRRSEKRARPLSARAAEGGVSTRKRRRISENINDDREHENGLPPFVPGLIDKLCDAFSCPSASSQLLEGVVCITRQRGFSSVDEEAFTGTDTASMTLKLPYGDGVLTPSRLPALLIVMIICLVTLGTEQQGADADEESYQSQRATAIAVVRGIPEGQRVTDEDLIGDIEGFLHAAGDEGWLKLPWFAPIASVPAPPALATVVTTREEEETAAMPSDSSDPLTTERLDLRPTRTKQAKTPLHRKEKHLPKPNGTVQLDKDDTDNDDDEDAPAGLQPGLGTMFQDALDWLAPYRRAEYALWEKEITARIEQIEREDAGGGRDVPADGQGDDRGSQATRGGARRGKRAGRGRGKAVGRVRGMVREIESRAA